VKTATLESDVDCGPERPLNLLAAMALWAGLSIDPPELRLDVHVLKVKPFRFAEDWCWARSARPSVDILNSARAGRLIMVGSLSWPPFSAWGPRRSAGTTGRSG